APRAEHAWPDARTAPVAPVARSAAPAAAPVARSAPAASARPEPVEGRATSAPGSDFKDALLAEVRKTKMAFYGTVIAQAQKIEVAGDSLTVTFGPNQRALRDMFEQNRPWLETIAQQVAGRKIVVAPEQTDAAALLVEGSQPPAVDKKSSD